MVERPNKNLCLHYFIFDSLFAYIDVLPYAMRRRRKILGPCGPLEETQIGGTPKFENTHFHKV